MLNMNVTQLGIKMQPEITWRNKYFGPQEKAGKKNLRNSKFINIQKMLASKNLVIPDFEQLIFFSISYYENSYLESS